MPGGGHNSQVRLTISRLAAPASSLRLGRSVGSCRSSSPAGPGARLGDQMERIDDATFESLHRLIGSDLDDWENDRPAPTQAGGFTYCDDQNFDENYPADPVSTDDPEYLG